MKLEKKEEKEQQHQQLRGAQENEADKGVEEVKGVKEVGEADVDLWQRYSLVSPHCATTGVKGMSGILVYGLFVRLSSLPDTSLWSRWNLWSRWRWWRRRRE